MVNRCWNYATVTICIGQLHSAHVHVHVHVHMYMYMQLAAIVLAPETFAVFEVDGMMQFSIRCYEPIQIMFSVVIIRFCIQLAILLSINILMQMWAA